MITLRAVKTDGDREAWIGVRRAVAPTESAGSIELLRERDNPERLLLLAELDGRLVGSGIADRSDIRTRVFVAPRVLPESRRRGVGTALLRKLAQHAENLGLRELSAIVADEGSQAFAERFGFEEAVRQVEQVRLLGEELPPFPFPEGLEVTTVAARPELLREAYPLACQGYADLATDAPATVLLEHWLREEATLPEGSFVALADGEVVGYSGLIQHDNPGVAEDGLTVVRRDWRRRGLALALKRTELEWASAHGLREVVTWTQRGNDAMRRVNELLGYEYRDLAVTMRARLPLPVD